MEYITSEMSEKPPCLIFLVTENMVVNGRRKKTEIFIHKFIFKDLIQFQRNHFILGIL